MTLNMAAMLTQHLAGAHAAARDASAVCCCQVAPSCSTHPMYQFFAPPQVQAREVAPTRLVLKAIALWHAFMLVYFLGQACTAVLGANRLCVLNDLSILVSGRLRSDRQF